MSDTSAAVAALGQLVGFANAIKDAHAIIDALSHSEQIASELDAAIAQKRADLEKASTDLAGVRDTAATLTAQANDLMAKATADADAAKKAADLYVTRTQAAANEQLQQVNDQVLLAQNELGQLKAEIIDEQKALDDLNARIDAGKAAAKAAFGA